MFDPEQRQERGRAARANAEALAAADDLLRADMGRAYTHESLTQQLGLSWGEVSDIEFVASSLDTTATALAVGVDLIVPADRAGQLARAGWLHALDAYSLDGELDQVPQGVLWFDGRVDVIGCECGQDHPVVAGLVWRRSLVADGTPGLLVSVIADTRSLDGPSLPTYVLDGLVLFTGQGMAENVPAHAAEGSLEWATGVARWALHQTLPLGVSDT